MTTLFIGVVSHEGSRFAVSQGPLGLAAQLVSALSVRGITSQVVVNTRDEYDAHALPITESVVQASLTAQLHLDRQWSAYLQLPRGPRWWAVHALRWLRRAGLRLHSPGPRAVERLLNIEFSHLTLLRAGVTSGASWVLILEDDAASLDIDDCSAGLAGLLERTAHSQPAFVNISESFSAEDLGIAHLLTEVTTSDWAGGANRRLLQSSRPVTNTVCAMLYRAEFAARLVAVLDSLPLEPVVPIDWKLNAALMRMHAEGELVPGDCWLVDPAPIDQLSMRTAFAS